MEESKYWWQSRTVWASVATMLVGVATSLGWVSQVAGADIVNTLPDLIAGIATVVGGALALYGRVKATKTIGDGS